MGNPFDGNCNRKAVNIFGTDPVVEARMKDEGGCNDKIREPVPRYNNAPSEVFHYHGENNAWVILGRDRFADECSGYGGKAYTQSGAIDLVVGLGAPWPREYIGSTRTEPLDKNFTTDAARIYISQKADIDQYFNLHEKAKGTVGISQGKSAIGIKADAVRIMAREGIKLVTNTDIKNSQGCDISTIKGIDLIAGNNDWDLQPMVKGDSLIDSIQFLIHHIEKLNGVVGSILFAQSQFNNVLSHHFHIGNLGAPTSPSFPLEIAGQQVLITLMQKGMMGLTANRANLKLFRANYLTPTSDLYILSRYNNCT